MRGTHFVATERGATEITYTSTIPQIMPVYRNLLARPAKPSRTVGWHQGLWQRGIQGRSLRETE